MTTVRFEPAQGVRGVLTAPSDKSISHRAALFAAMAEGTSRIEGYLRAADTDATLRVIEQLGAGVKVDTSSVVIEGVGLRGPRSAVGGLNVDNSGTLMRLLSGWLAGQPGGAWAIDGDSSIRSRPIDRVAQPLERMGASFESNGGRPPFEVRGARLSSIDFEMPVPSAQVKSAVLIAGLLADGTTTVREPVRSRDHTERMLAEQGAELTIAPQSSGSVISISGCESLAPVDRRVPGDPSSAAFALVAALLVPGSRVTVENVCLNPGRIGLFRLLQNMGADLSGLPDLQESEGAGSDVEPSGSLEAQHSQLIATDVGASEVPAAIDELPLLALAACFAEGRTTVRGAEELRVKETDRISTVVEGLRGLGADIEALEDGFTVVGGGGLRGGSIESHGDHRIAMMGAIAGLASEEGVEVSGFDAVAVSYPGFEADIGALT